MTLVTNKRQLFVKQYGIGTGHYYRTIHGNGLFSDSMKKLGRLLSQGMKELYARAKPKTIQFLKDTAVHLKPKIKETLKRASESAIDALIGENASGIPKRLRRTFDDTKHNILENLKEAAPQIKRSAVNTVFDIAHGSGLRLSSSSKKEISRLLK